jgi:hypothetical protein
MNKREKIEREIDKTLGQFEKKDSLEPNPYLNTRIQQRLDERNRKKLNFSAILKPAFFTALIAINLYTAVWYINLSDAYNYADSNQGLVEILSSDFNLENDQSDILIVE